MKIKALLSRLVTVTLVAGAVLGIVGALLPHVIADSPVLGARLVAHLRTWTGGAVTIAGPVTVNDPFSLTIEAKRVTVKGMASPAGVRGFTAERVQARLDWFELLLGRLVFNRLTMDAADIELADTAEGGPADSDLAPHLRRLLSLVADSPFPKLVLRDSVVSLREAPGTPLQRLAAAEVRMWSAPAGGEGGIRGRLRWRDQELTFEIERGPETAAGQGRVAPLAMTVAAPFAQLAIDGEMVSADRARLRGEADVQVSDPQALMRWLDMGVALPWPVRRFAAQGRFAHHGGELSVSDVSLTLDGLQATGALAVRLDGPRPKIDGTLAVGKVALAPYLEAARGGPDGPTAAVAAPAGALIDAVDADLRLSVGTITAGGMTAGPAGLTLSLKAGTLVANVAELGLFNGSLRGRFERHGAGAHPRFKIRATAEEIDIAGLLAAAGLGPWLVGSADVNGHVMAQGADREELLASLQGRVRLVVAEGAILGLDVPALAARAAGATLQGWGGTRPGRAAYDELRADCAVVGGRFTCNAKALADAGGTLTGQGMIDLPSRTVAWTLALPSPPGGGRDQARPVTMTIDGPWAAPTIRMDGAAADGDRPRRSGAASDASGQSFLGRIGRWFE